MTNPPTSPPADEAPGQEPPRDPTSAQPWSGPLPVEPYQPPPTYRPGYAKPATPGHEPTAEFPIINPPPGYAQPGSAPGYGYGPTPPTRSRIPLIAVTVAVALLLCAGAGTAAMLAGRTAADRAKGVVEPITAPTLPTKVPTTTPPTPAGDGAGDGTAITVVYEVTGNGPAEILYTGKLGDKPKRVGNAKLPWRVKTTTDSAAFISVTAVRISAGDGTIQCRATADGKQVAQSRHDGAFATVSCNKFLFK